MTRAHCSRIERRRGRLCAVCSYGDCSRSQGPICWLRAGGRDTRCAHRGRVEIRRALRAVAMDDAQHRAVVVAQYDRADSAMIETLGAERQMVIVAHDMSWL